MKRKVFAAVFCCILLISCIGGVSAVAPRVIDEAGVLTDEEISELEYEAIRLINQYDMDMVILLVEDLDGESLRDYADDYYDAFHYGRGDDESGFLLLMDMGSRDWWITTKGRAIEALTDYGRQELFDNAAPYFGDDDWFGGLQAYLAAFPYYLDAYEAGDPVDLLVGEKDDGISWMGILIALVVGLAAGGITVYAMKSTMDTTDNQRSAGDYLQYDSYHLNQNSDLFLYSEVHKTAKPKDSDSGGGSSTHTSSSGDTHGGGGGSF